MKNQKNDDAIKGVTLLRNEKKTSREKCYKSARRLFVAGCTINKSTTTLFDTDIAILANVHPTRIKSAKLVAKFLDNDINKFDALFKSGEVKSWNGLVELATGKKEIVTDYTLQHWELTLLKIIRRFSANPAKTLYYNVLSRAQNKISKIVPPKPMISNHNFLKYFDCCCCGQEAPSAGHNVVRYKIIPYVWFPRCEDCDLFKKDPDLMRLLKMYVTYTIDLDNTLNSIDG